jgi:LCP family protein required for cell wall assembly
MTKQPSMDGFVPRRPNNPGIAGNSNVPQRQLPRPERPQLGQPHRPLAQNRPPVATEHPSASTAHGLSRADVDDSLRQIDETDDSGNQVPQGRGGARSHRKRWIKRLIIALLVIFLAIGVWIGIRTVLAGSSVFKGDIFGIIQQKQLKTDATGRSNILIFGTSEDDEGGDHPGAFLTDSIMVLSVDQKKKDAFMVSIPRDLWVKFGRACNAGYEGKINELYNCHSNAGEDGDEGAKGLAAKAAEVTGLDVQYTVHVNYTVVRQAVDAVGGVNVDVQGNGPVPYGVKEGSILDRNFDWKCGNKCYYVKYEPGVHEMDGEHALAFMRARNAQGGYGLAQGNFDREKNQQKVIVALREKALSVGTLANPGKVMNLISALGDNLNTNFDTSEIRTLMALGSEIEASSITSIDLVDDVEPVMTTGDLGGASVVKPVDGLFDYSGVASYIRKNISSDPAAKEGANVVVLNGSGVAGAASTAATRLEDMGFTIADVGNAPDAKYERREVYQRDATSKPLTRTKLTNMYGAPKLGLEKFGVSSDVDFVIVIGEADPTTE